VVGTLPPESPASSDEASNDPAAILELWTALEVLSPQTYLRPEDLADGDARRIAWFGDGRALPWMGAPEKARPHTKLYYQVVLGGVPMDVASTALLKAFGDKRPERPAPRGLAALAAVTLDRGGRPVAEDPIAISSFGWGYGLARAGRLSELKAWPQVERRLVEGLEQRLKREQDDEILPLDEATILSAHSWLCDQIRLPETERVAPSFAIRLYRWYQAPGNPDPMLLNSFFLDDLVRARELHRQNRLGTALARYLGIAQPEDPLDLLTDKVALEDAVAPKLTPPARWPTPGGHSLVLLQQAAVNLAFAELGKSAGILGVNGPPGTGKTTLLRDLVAGVILERARALVGFEDPEEAFSHQGKIRRGQTFVHLYELSAPIRGHELLVASSNNRAVENISRELPGRGQIETSLVPRYFPTIAASVAGEDQDAWGLIAGVLGNAANRVAFRRDFWANPDNGMRAYLWAASGNEATIERENPKTGAKEAVNANVVIQERPPRDKNDALTRWQRARREFRRALKDAETALAELERVREALAARTLILTKRADTEERVRSVTTQLQLAQAQRQQAIREYSAAASARERAESILMEHMGVKPGLLARLFRRVSWVMWKTERDARDRTAKNARQGVVAAREAVTEAEREANSLTGAVSSASEDLARITAEAADIESRLSVARVALNRQLADEYFWRASHSDLQTSTPWLAPGVQRLRDLCFAKALELHRAFIDVAAKPIRNNLNALFSILMGGGIDDTTRRLLPSLWSTLFLVVPVISTTFASVGRMLGPMSPESLGWLLVDEAGQALPQAAVGAIVRARRAIIVGDPLQIEPIVSLPLSLVERIALRMSVDSATWAAPKASAQTVADAVSRHQSWLEQIEGAVRVGIPLLVHRRCAEPMFSISNAVAYAGKMVSAKPPKISAVRDALGPARWLHVSGSGSGKWCRAEGELIVSMLSQLLDRGVESPDMFVISPFRIVAQQMREMLATSDAVRRITDRPWQWARDRVGTVHTFQGREAEAVFLLLGAPEVEQVGARNWAGHPPNLANVAVSRAKEVLYVVGNREHWRAHGSFRIVSERLPA